jgi:hypothetical protein
MKVHLTTKQKISIGVAITAILGGSAYLIIHRIKAKKIYNQLMADLTAGTGATGTITDLTVSGQPLDPNYFKNSGSTNLLTDAQVQTGITNINKWIGHEYLPDSDEKSILAYLKSLQNKAQVSQLAAAYMAKYGVALLDDLATVDYTIGGITWPGTHLYLPDFKAAIDALPAK